MKILKSSEFMVVMMIIILTSLAFIFRGSFENMKIQTMQKDEYIKQLQIENLQEEKINEGCIKITGQVKNVLDRDIKYIEVGLYIFDEDGNKIHGDICNDTDIKINEYLYFEFYVYFDDFEIYRTIIDNVEV